ncbi:MAG: twin-arginine translocase TatA/TatE family subunit [Candidatus Marinimicrobia bacterium]|jgi:sec-independent protein translocase protein TatA|nr:twin-arginine translocase TatA/TatE family subunit [Candidatus Neomarinimicrobiota bacterium]MDP6400755.1 twin-arginine translocase TatA/TatE family subunit [Candidatus Neomarinimicrobiota bacterium]MDP6612258.1 twin-arginine translocase TatA/TatE family subunit [Candidatus Neomarinimicrobiota bacterium]MDP6821040.1 twin-arginine translocase TatA/TatE family subunit [Candidatus Neomarinimicrobiota bacterium]MDP6861158.1 twin-arginine translocase TatA/TatE family subunit [Candidatus Neomarini|tara:strand:+ start:219 stop:413 length:195 start_codon:yes stop_codon:yes gene_type:complete
MNLGTWEIILILAGVIILFGGKKIPELARGLGESIKEFKRTASSIQDEAKQHTKEIKELVNHES